ncbi:hypothetical protein PO002_22370 [Cupriavidus necator]|uniref:hypothetical protein n=1 Tax=Cupriavidus necator TaxID=106590 RepID=UPI0039C49B08
MLFVPAVTALSPAGAAHGSSPDVEPGPRAASASREQRADPGYPWRAGRKCKYYEPADIRVPVLLVHGAWGIDVPIGLAQALFLELRSAPYRQWAEIGEATHLVLLGKNRLLAFLAIRDFYDRAFQGEPGKR